MLTASDEDRKIFAARGGSTLLLLAAAFLAAALVYIARQSLFSHSGDIDYRNFWAGGHNWALGRNPYSQDFYTDNAAYFNDPPLLLWTYLPNIWVVARLLALFPPHTGLLIWRTASALCIVGGALIACHARLVRPDRRNAWMVAVITGMLASGYASSLSLSLGQLSPLIFLGWALIYAGLVRGSAPPLALGVAIVLLKPQVALVGVLILLLKPATRWPTIAGGLLAAASGLYPLASVGLVPTVTGLIANLRLYGRFPGNLPDHLTGLVNLTAHAGHAVPSWSGILLALLTAGLFAWATSPGRAGEDQGAADGIDADRAMLAIIGISSALLPLHFYDLLWLGLVPLMNRHLGNGARWTLAASALVQYRAGNIARILGHVGLHDPDGSMISTCAAMLVLGVVLADLGRASKAGGKRKGSSTRPAVAGAVHRSMAR